MAITGTISENNVYAALTQNNVYATLTQNNVYATVVDSSTITGGTGTTFQYEAETFLLVNRYETAPTEALKLLINTTIKDLKTAGLWNKLEVIYTFNIHTAQASLQNWKSNTFNAQAVNAPTFTAKVGWMGASTGSRYLNTGGFIPSQSQLFTLNCTTTFFKAWSLNTSTTTYLFGVSDINTYTGNRNYFVTYASSNERYYHNGTLPISPFDVQLNHLYSYSTNGNANESYHNGGEKATSTTTKSGISTIPMYLVGTNNNGTGSGSNNTGLAILILGAYLTEAENITLYNIMNYFDTNVGGTF